MKTMNCFYLQEGGKLNATLLPNVLQYKCATQRRCHKNNCLAHKKIT